jgi:hypothetical protein
VKNEESDALSYLELFRLSRLHVPAAIACTDRAEREAGGYAASYTHIRKKTI